MADELQGAGDAAILHGISVSVRCSVVFSE